MERHGLESEVMSTFASQVLRLMIYHGLHDQCPTIGKEFVEGIEVFMLETGCGVMWS